MTEHFESPADGAWTRESLLAAEIAGHRLKFVFFWGDRPSRSGRIGAFVLSQWYAHAFVVDGTTFQTAEHFMMAEKAKLFGDTHHYDLILAAASPGEAKELGRHVRGFDEEVWRAHRLSIVVRGSVAKFGSEKAMRHYLVSTGDRVLVEASPRDRVWGIGMAKNDPRAERPSDWNGENLLGFALMQARAELRSR